MLLLDKYLPIGPMFYSLSSAPTVNDGGDIAGWGEPERSRPTSPSAADRRQEAHRSERQLQRGAPIAAERKTKVSCDNAVARLERGAPVAMQLGD
jgi:hypothetical protein